ncbi:MAG TPA: hypothetical protein VGP90_15305 [Acidimicrobiia bacterium]|jgi:hypothetical protein|nr:hypothetical protein [Acidimicrobiia bacterium]
MTMAPQQWSVGIEATGDEVMTTERIGDLADAVADAGGIATGIGRPAYGVTVLVTADDRDDAINQATEILRRAARQAGLPPWPVSRVEATSEEEAEIS